MAFFVYGGYVSNGYVAILSSSSPIQSEPSAGFEGLRAEECGVLNGCENGRCVRVREGYTCDCFDGFQLDLTKMACVGKPRPLFAPHTHTSLGQATGFPEENV